MSRVMSLLLPAVLVACTGPENNVSTLEPVIAVFPSALDFGDTIVTTSLVLPLEIQNAGDGDLEVTFTLADADGVFELADTGGIIIPADHEPEEGEHVGSWPLPILFTPSTYLPYEATLTIASNDDDTPELVVPILGEGVYAPTPDIALSPETLDFGVVAQGSSTMLLLNLENVGDATLTVGEVLQTGSGAFQLTTDPSGAIVGGGDLLPVAITYAPTSDQGDSAWLTFPSDDPDEPEVEVLLLGNGGGDFEYPVAIIDCPGTSGPPDTVTLDGTQSYDPAGQPLTYQWTVVAMPDSSEGSLTTQVGATTDLYTDIAGAYEVTLIVTNEQGTMSAPDRCTIDAIPEDDLHVELTWDTIDTDMDLHVLEEGAALYDVPGDCSWCNKNPQWGAAGTDDDPRLDLDDIFDGPENTNLLSPADGAYPIKVHYFDGAGPVTATIRVWTYGVEVFSASKVMKFNEVWDVGQVNWPDGTVAVSAEPLYEAPARGCP